MKTRDENFHDALTLRGLLERLQTIVAENDRCWPERNDLPVVVEVPQPATQGGDRRSGSLRPSVYLPLAYACSGMLTFGTGEATKVQVMTLQTARGVGYTSGKRVTKIRLANDEKP